MALQVYFDPAGQQYVGTDGTQYGLRPDGGLVPQDTNGNVIGPILAPGQFDVLNGPTVPAGADRSNAFLSVNDGTPQYNGIQGGYTGHYDASGNFVPETAQSAGNSFGPLGLGNFLLPAAMGAIGLGAAGLGPLAGAPGTSSGSFPAGSFNVADAGVSDVPQGYFQMASNGANLNAADPSLVNAQTIASGAGAYDPAVLNATMGAAGANAATSGLFSGLGAGLGSGLGGLASGLISNPALLGAGAGALLGGLSGGSKPAGNITSVQDIPDWLKPYVSSNLNSAASNMGAASAASSLLPQAQNQLSATINGNYLNPSSNPALQPYAQDLMGQAGSQFLGTFGGPAGSNINNSGLQEGYTRAITNAVLPLYNSAYNTERANQGAAAGAAPSFAGQASQAVLGPNTAFSGLIPNLRTQSQPYFSNAFSNAASGALGGYALGKAFG